MRRVELVERLMGGMKVLLNGQVYKVVRSPIETHNFAFRNVNDPEDYFWVDRHFKNDNVESGYYSIYKNGKRVSTHTSFNKIIKW